MTRFVYTAPNSGVSLSESHTSELKCKCFMSDITSTVRVMDTQLNHSEPHWANTKAVSSQPPFYK